MFAVTVKKGFAVFTMEPTDRILYLPKYQSWFLFFLPCDMFRQYVVIEDILHKSIK